MCSFSPVRARRPPRTGFFKVHGHSESWKRSALDDVRNWLIREHDLASS